VQLNGWPGTNPHQAAQSAKKRQMAAPALQKREKLESIIHTFYAKQSQFVKCRNECKLNVNKGL